MVQEANQKHRVVSMHDMVKNSRDDIKNPNHGGLKKLRSWLGLSLFVVLAASGLVWQIFATQTDNRADTMSNQAAGESSDHTISFNLSSGNTFAAGEIIAIDFPSGFTQNGTWATSDFSFTDGTARTISAINAGGGTSTVSCSDGANNVGVAIDTTDLVFRLIPCGASFSASATGAYINFVINGASPGGQVVNPVAVGSYVVDMLDAAGDCVDVTDSCGISVPIVTDSSITVNAWVQGCGDGIVAGAEQCDDGNTVNGDGCSSTCQSESGGGGPTDPGPPIISNIQVTDILTDGAKVTWDTDQNSTTTIRYGLTASYGSTSTDSGLVYNHTRTLTSLSEGTIYHFQVCSTNSFGSQACSGDQTFTTDDDTPPVISNVQTSTTNNSATITWITDENAASYVDWGSAAGPPYTTTDGTASPLVTSHSVTINGLSEATTYHFRVRSVDASANEAFTSDSTFVTASTQPPVISNVQITNVSDTGAVVSWTTDVNATTFVDYGTSTGSYTLIEGSATPLTTTHVATLAGLTPGTTYYLRVRSADFWSNQSTSGEQSFMTSESVPPVISGINVTGLTSSGATINWTTDENSTSVVEYGTSPALGSVASVAGLTSPSHAVPISGLTPGVTVYYKVKSADQWGNESVSSVASFIVPFPAPPVISGITVTNLTPTSTRITWDTDISSNSLVEYGLTVTYGASVANASSVTSHSLTLTGLTPNTLYNYRVTSSDQYDQSTTTANRTFTSAPPPALTITDIQVTNITETGARITWTTSQAASTKAEWGLTTSYGTQWTSATLTTSHLAVVTGLTQGTLYHYKLTAKDSYNQTVSSTDRTFTTTADTVPPANPTNFNAIAGDQQVALSWVNPTDADFQGVRIVRKTSGFPTGPTDGTAVYSGTATLFTDTGRTNGVQYFYAIYAFDEVPNYSSGAVASATPVGALDITPPANVTNLQATAGNQQISLSWANPTDIDFQGTMIVRKSLTCPTSRTDGNLIYDGTDTTRIDTGLTNGTLYCYRAFAHDAVPNYASGVNAQATPIAPPDTTAPASVTNLQASPGDAQVQLSWVNPSDSDWAGTRIVRKTGSAPTSPTDGTIIFSGVGADVLDNSVTNGITYYYSAFSYDSKPNYSPPVSVSAMPQAGSTVVAIDCSDSDGGINYQVSGTVTLSDDSSYDDVCSEGKIREYYCENSSVNNILHACDPGYKCSAGTCIPDVQEPVPVICGDGSCEGYENSLNCPADCPIIPTAPPVEVVPVTVPEVERMKITDVLFYATRGRIRLRLDGSMLQVYNNMTFTVKIPNSAIHKPIESAYINYGSSSYVMKQTGSYEAQVVSAAASSDVPLTISVTYEDGDADNLVYTVHAIGRPVVSGQVEDQDGRPLKGVRVTLMHEQSGGFGVYDLSQSNQLNPQITDVNGRYGFVLPEGTYRLRFDAEGYNSRELLSFKMTTDNVVSKSVSLTKLPPTVQNIVEVITSEGTVVQKATKIVDNVGQQASYVAEVTAQNVVDAVSNSIVQDQTQAVVTPTATAVTVVNVVTAAAVLPYLNFVLSLLAHPILLIARRRRKQWGVVYNSLNKMPVDLAIVRLTDAKTGRIVRSAVTDKDGRYFFIVDEGEYKINSVKAGFAFPSDYLKNQKSDAQYTDIYHGDVISAKKDDAIVVNIPLDPVDAAAKPPWRVTFDGILRRFQRALGVVAILAMVVVAGMNPSPLTIGLLAANVIFYLLFRRLAKAKKPKNWGVVYDEKSRKPLSNVVVRIFESRFNKLLETQVTDIRGRYAFLVGNNVYYVTYEKPGYQKQQKGPVDYAINAEKKTKKTEANVVAVDVKLKKDKNASDPHKPKDKSVDSTPDTGKSAVGEQSATSTNVPRAESRHGRRDAVERPPQEAQVESAEKPKNRGLWELEMIKKMQQKDGGVSKQGKALDSAPTEVSGLHSGDIASGAEEDASTSTPRAESNPDIPQEETAPNIPRAENSVVERPPQEAQAESAEKPKNRGLWELEMIKKMSGSAKTDATDSETPAEKGIALHSDQHSPMEGAAVVSGSLLGGPEETVDKQEAEDEEKD